MNAREAPLSLFGEPAKPWAIFSTDGGGKDGLGAYRYVLAWPTGLDDDRYALWCLANPSTATPEQTDRTVARTIVYSRSWGFGWSRVVNVRAWRETNPKLVPPDPLAIGPENDRHIAQQARGAAIVIVGWGKLGGERGKHVLRGLDVAGVRVFALHLNDDGSPGHPLYLRGDAQPIPMAVP